MHTFIKIRVFTTPSYYITMDSITAAINDLKLQDKPNIAATAKRYEVERSTLSRRFRGVTESKDHANQELLLLSPQQEQVLVNYINKLTEIGLPPTVAIVRNFATNIAGKLPSKS